MFTAVETGEREGLGPEACCGFEFAMGFRFARIFLKQNG